MEEIRMVTTPAIYTPTLILTGTIMACVLFLLRIYMKERNTPLLELLAGSGESSRSGPKEPTI